MSHSMSETYYTKNLSIIYPKFKLNWAPCISSGNPIPKSLGNSS